MSKIILWGVSLSPFVRKVQVALAEKQLAYEHRQILPKAILEAKQENVPIDFAKVSPLGKIPALQIDDYCVADSAVICSFLDKNYPSEKKLYPTDPKLYARALWFENYADNILSQITHRKIFLEKVVKPALFGTTPDEAMLAEAREELSPYLDYLNTEISQTTWFAGDDFSMADVAVATHFISLEQAGYELDTARWRHLGDFLTNIKRHPSVKQVLA